MYMIAYDLYGENDYITDEIKYTASKYKDISITSLGTRILISSNHVLHIVEFMLNHFEITEEEVLEHIIAIPTEHKSNGTKK